jgi:hypothetical protein
MYLPNPRHPAGQTALPPAPLPPGTTTMPKCLSPYNQTLLIASPGNHDSGCPASACQRLPPRDAFQSLAAGPLSIFRQALSEPR